MRWTADFFVSEEDFVHTPFDSLSDFQDMDEPASFIPGSENGCEKNDWNSPSFIPRTSHDNSWI